MSVTLSHQPLCGFAIDECGRIKGRSGRARVDMPKKCSARVQHDRSAGYPSSQVHGLGPCIGSDNERLVCQTRVRDRPSAPALWVREKCAEKVSDAVHTDREQLVECDPSAATICAREDLARAFPAFPLFPAFLAFFFWLFLKQKKTREKIK